MKSTADRLNEHRRYAEDGGQRSSTPSARYGRGEPCKPGETAARSGCRPADGSGGGDLSAEIDAARGIPKDVKAELKGGGGSTPAEVARAMLSGRHRPKNAKAVALLERIAKGPAEEAKPEPEPKVASAVTIESVTPRKMSKAERASFQGWVKMPDGSIANAHNFPGGVKLLRVEQGYVIGEGSKTLVGSDFEMSHREQVSDNRSVRVFKIKEPEPAPDPVNAAAEAQQSTGQSWPSLDSIAARMGGRPRDVAKAIAQAQREGKVRLGRWNRNLVELRDHPAADFSFVRKIGGDLAVGYDEIQKAINSRTVEASAPIWSFARPEPKRASARTYAAGQPCKKGEAAARTGCIPKRDEKGQ